MNFIKKLLVNPFLYFPLITILLINNWEVAVSVGYSSVDLDATMSDVGSGILLMSQLAILLFGIIFILDNIIKLPQWIFWVLVLPYVLWILASFSEFEYWFSFWLVIGGLYYGIYWLCGFLSKKLNVEENSGFNFLTDEILESNHNSEETEETEEQSKNNEESSKKE
jgi:hypothetical protein